MMSDFKENEFDYMEEPEIIELKMDELYNLKGDFDKYVEYIIYSAETNSDYRILFNEENQLFEVIYFETHYTKFWDSNVPLEKYLKLKVKYFVERGYDAEFNNDDDCHPAIEFLIGVKEADLKDAVRKIEEINEKFEENIDELELQLEAVINNYKFK